MACCPEPLICLGTRVRAPTRWQPESDWSSALLVDTGPAASLAVVDASVTVSLSLVGHCWATIRPLFPADPRNVATRQRDVWVRALLAGRRAHSSSEPVGPR